MCIRDRYIKNEWEGKREGRSWQQVMTNLELSKKYQEKDAAGYSATLEKAGKVFQKNPLFMAKNLMLKGEDEAAVRLLENDTEKLPYYEVTRRLDVYKRQFRELFHQLSEYRAGADDTR